MSFLSKKECEGPIKCPVMTTLSVIGGKWKPGILWELQNNEILRFGQLKKDWELLLRKC